MIRRSVWESWSPGIQNESHYFNSFEFKLNSYPFSNTLTCPFDVCILIMHLIHNLETNANVKFLCSADLSNICGCKDDVKLANKSFFQDIHTLFFLIQ